MSLAENIDTIWYNGKLVKTAEVSVSPLTHTLHYGVGVWEGLRCYQTADGPAIFRLTDHTQRLFNSAKIIGMSIPFDQNTINQAHLDVIRCNNLSQSYIRPIVFYGDDRLGLNAKDLSVNVAIMPWRWDNYLNENAARDGIHVGVSSFSRHHPHSSLYKAKAVGNYINSVLAANQAHRHGYDEAILVDHQGHIAEGSGQNIFLVRDGMLLTPDTASILEGITRKTIMTLAEHLGYPVSERRILRDDLYCADEAFFTGTASEVVPICRADGRIIGDGKPGTITRQLQQAYLDVVAGKLNAYHDWLNYVK